MKKTIVISSDTRKAGKTLLCEAVTGRFSRAGITVTCMKLSPERRDSSHPPAPGKTDTRRYAAAGAANTIFHRYASPENLEGFLDDLDVTTDILVIESNTILRFLEPDLHVHITMEGKPKHSALDLAGRADIVTKGPLSPKTCRSIAGFVPALVGLRRASSISFGGKHWINVEGNPLFGDGRMDLLKAVKEHGSILRAANATGMQYKRAWVMIREAEEKLGADLVCSNRGGTGGGGTTVTPLAEKLMEIWEESRRSFLEMLERLETP